MRSTLRLYLPFVIVFTAFLLMAYSSGVVATTGQGYTGAPSSGGGMESTCSICHSGGPFGEPQLTLMLDSVEASSYQPGRTYSVTVAMRSSMGSPAGFGFLGQFLDTSDPAPSTAGTFAAPGANTRISTGTNGRLFVEHQRINRDSLFSFEWTAPTAGTGNVNFYAVGNAVDGTGGTSGDNGSTQPLIVELTEDSTTTSLAQIHKLPLRVYPNPVRDLATLSVELPRAGRYGIHLYTVTGALLGQREASLLAGPNQLSIDLGGYPSGLYQVVISGRHAYGSLRLVRE